MSIYVIALAIAGAMSVPAAAQPAQTAPTTKAVQPVKPQMVKKKVCEPNDNPYSHISRICHTVMVPEQPTPNQQPQAPQTSQGN